MVMPLLLSLLSMLLLLVWPGGVDVELGQTLNSYALAAIADGNITMDDVTTAVLRTTAMIFRLGLVDSPSLVPFASLQAHFALF
jgi:hypothetical protein